MSGTDHEWELWGRRDPYYGVITCERFRSHRLTDESRAEFFSTGPMHVASVLQTCRTHFDASYAPRRVLDFGCGVGRLLVPFAELAQEVVGIDVSQSMLAEAGRNCAERGLANVKLLRSDDALSGVEGLFDLVHSTIVFQHIEIARGRSIFARLLQHLAPGGMAALQLTYGKAYYPQTLGQPPPQLLADAVKPAAKTVVRWWRQRVTSGASESSTGAPTPETHDAVEDPQMLMNPYNLSEIAFLVQSAGIRRFHAEFTDHGGELGVLMFFQRPAAAA